MLCRDVGGAALVGGVGQSGADVDYLAVTLLHHDLGDLVTQEINGVEVGVDANFVLEGEKILLSLKSPTQAITIEPVEKDEEFSYFYMILPVRMNDQK